MKDKMIYSPVAPVPLLQYIECSLTIVLKIYHHTININNCFVFSDIDIVQNVLNLNRHHCKLNPKGSKFGYKTRLVIRRT